jgi:hypothetical protein
MSVKVTAREGLSWAMNSRMMRRSSWAAGKYRTGRLAGMELPPQLSHHLAVCDPLLTGGSLGLSDCELGEEFCLGFQPFIMFNGRYDEFSFAIFGKVHGNI